MVRFVGWRQSGESSSVWKMTQRENELISAYLDGELADEDRSRLEAEVLPDTAAQASLTSFRQLGDRIRQLPSLHLPEDFQQRVLSAAEDAKAAPADLETAAHGSLVSRALIALGTLAAVVALIVVSAQNGRQQPDAPGIAGFSKGTDKGDSTSRNVSVEAPKYIFIMDVTLSENGNKKQALRALLRRHEIFFDSNLRPSQELEQKLLDSRYVNKLPANTQAAAAELIYVEMDVFELNEVYTQINSQPQDFHRLKFDMSKQPEDMHIFERLRRSAAAQFANAAPKRRAWRIELGVPVQSQLTLAASISPLNLLRKQLTQPSKKTRPTKKGVRPLEKVKAPILIIVHR